MATLSKRICLILSLLILCCGSASAAEGSLNKIAAVVNGEIITLHTLRNNTKAELARQKISENDPRVPEVMRHILDAMINDILLRQEAARYKVTITDNEVDAEVRSILKNNQLTQSAFEAQLAQQGTNLEAFKEQMKNNMLRKRMISLMISRKVIVTKDEIAAYYEQHKDQFSGQKYVDFSVIVFNPSVKPQGIYSQLKSGSLSFEEAAQRYSIDVSSQNGGRIGRVTWNALSPKVREAFSSLSAGQVTPVLKLEGKNVVFRLNDIGEGAPQTLEQASARIEEALREPRLQERFMEYSKQLRSKAVLDIRI